MAKKEITRGSFNIENLATNVKRVKEQLAEQTAEKEVYNIIIRADVEAKELFDKHYAKYMYSVRNVGKFPKKMFFRLILLKYKELLEAQNAYFVVEDESIVYNLLGRGGFRGERKQAKSILFGQYQGDDDTRDIYHNISYSIAKSENMENEQLYTSGYFFEKVLSSFVERIDKYIAEANKK